LIDRDGIIKSILGTGVEGFRIPGPEDLKPTIFAD
jgi:hypothetical protein